MRMYREHELIRVREIFEMWASKTKGTLSHEDLRTALTELGCVDAERTRPEELPKELLFNMYKGGKSIDLQEFVRIVVNPRRVARQAFRENSGFSASEILELKQLFRSYDDNSTGYLTKNEIIHLVEDTF